MILRLTPLSAAILTPLSAAILTPLSAVILTPLAAAALLGLASCSSTPPPAEPAKPAEPEPAPIALVNATVLATTCPQVTQYNARMAENAIRKLVEPCTKIPGGGARFTATMLPGGKIELGSPEGDPTEGVVPMCVVKNQLTHKIFLKKACVFRVELEERPMTPAQPTPSP
ncbi:MAG TPA: hypothetical protein VLS89_02790 [Candidatus Nanopelagicales bacterium]|nr:hypothetical protein [Candidatus Nanopelagicales bacterium]